MNYDFSRDAPIVGGDFVPTLESIMDNTKNCVLPQKLWPWLDIESRVIARYVCKGWNKWIPPGHWQCERLHAIQSSSDITDVKFWDEYHDDSCIVMNFSINGVCFYNWYTDSEFAGAITCTTNNKCEHGKRSLYESVPDFMELIISEIEDANYDLSIELGCSSKSKFK